MVLFSEERFAQDFQFDRLKQTIYTVMRSAVITPKSFYYFIQRYSDFNGSASAVMSHLVSSLALSPELCCDFVQTMANKSDRDFDRALAQDLLHGVGDYAQLSGPERHRIAQAPTWLTEVVQALGSHYQGMPGDVTALIRALGFYAASEMMGDLEQVVLDQVVHHNYPWRYALIRSQTEGHGNHCQPALNALNLTLDYRPELPEQIKAWVYEGYQNFIDLQQRLFYEIYRESLDLQYWEPNFVNLPVEIPANPPRPRPVQPYGLPVAAVAKSPLPSYQRTPSSLSSSHIQAE
jgi:hypothetical protein